MKIYITKQYSLGFSMSNNQTKQLGLWMATSLVLGNMIGSGIFLLPTTLAPYGGISIIGWLVTTVGAMAFAIVFSQLAEEYPATGGLYVYCKHEFGEAIGFLLAWAYWTSICVGTAAIAVAFTSYSSFFIPVLNTNPILGAACTLATLWILSLINAHSVFSGGIMQLVTTVLKIIPIILIAVFGLIKLDTSNFVPLNPSTETNISAILITANITLWAFLGLECASIPAGSIKNPKRTIPLATLLGTLIAAIIYISSTTAVMGVVKPSTLLNNAAPFTTAAQVIWGDFGSILIGIGAIIACLGAVNGWILVQGQMAFAMANDHLLPPIFTKKSKYNAPSMSIIISSTISSIVILMNYSDGLISMFNFMMLISTIMTLISFIFCSIARIMLLAKQNKPHKTKLTIISISVFAFIYGIFIVGSADENIVYWSMLMLLAGLPIYAWMKYHY